MKYAGELLCASCAYPLSPATAIVLDEDGQVRCAPCSAFAKHLSTHDRRLLRSMRIKAN